MSTQKAKQSRNHIRRIGLRGLAPIFGAAVLLAGVSTAKAQTTQSWIQAAGGDFTTAGNWSPGPAPVTTNDVAWFKTNGVFTVNFDQVISNRHAVIDAGTVTLALGNQTNWWLNPDPISGNFGLVVGEGNAATLLVTNGAINVYSYKLGQYENSFGTVILDGSNSRLTTRMTESGGTEIGIKGKGLLIVTNGAKASLGRAHLGSALNGYGEIQVTGTNSYLNIGNSSSAIGYSGAGATGLLEVARGAHIDQTGLRLGVLSGTVGFLKVHDTGSQYTCIYNASVGSAGTGYILAENEGLIHLSRETLIGSSGGTGAITIASGGRLIAPATTNVFIGYSANSVGAVTVTGTSTNGIHSSLSAGNVGVGGTDASSAGTGALSVSSNGYIALSGALKVWETGTLTVDGGTITAQNLDLKTNSVFRVILHTDGTNALITTTGNAAINDADLQVSIAEGFSAPSYQKFTIIDAAGTLVGTFKDKPDNCDVDGRRFRLHYDTVNGLVTLTYTVMRGTIFTVR